MKRTYPYCKVITSKNCIRLIRHDQPGKGGVYIEDSLGDHKRFESEMAADTFGRELLAGRIEGEMA